MLGALWADLSWGRFWGWDPKEVWALISLLVYLAFLHGRPVGWSGSFSIALGSVVGFAAIVWTWYAINFLMPGGKHSYGEGGGGLWLVLTVFALELVLVAAAAVRYFMPSAAVGTDDQGGEAHG